MVHYFFYHDCYTQYSLSGTLDIVPRNFRFRGTLWETLYPGYMFVYYISSFIDVGKMLHEVSGKINNSSVMLFIIGACRNNYFFKRTRTNWNNVRDINKHVSICECCIPFPWVLPSTLNEEFFFLADTRIAFIDVRALRTMIGSIFLRKSNTIFLRVSNYYYASVVKISLNSVYTRHSQQTK
jgi:hypothetical protein